MPTNRAIFDSSTPWVSGISSSSCRQRLQTPHDFIGPNSSTSQTLRLPNQPYGVRKLCFRLQTRCSPSVHPGDDHSDSKLRRHLPQTPSWPQADDPVCTAWQTPNNQTACSTLAGSYLKCKAEILRVESHSRQKAVLHRTRRIRDADANHSPE